MDQFCGALEGFVLDLINHHFNFSSLFLMITLNDSNCDFTNLMLVFSQIYLCSRGYPSTCKAFHLLIMLTVSPQPT